MNRKSILSIGIVLAVTMISMFLFDSIASNVGAQEQPIDTTQVKNYLTQALQALDSGNNTMVLEQLDLAEVAITGTTGEADDDEGEVEEGPGEDEDEPGDVDTNDQEDSP
jgi:hypothetical protein